MADTLVINGAQISSVNVNVNIYGITLQGITKIDYKRVGDHKVNYALGAEPYGIGFGQYKYTASITMYQEMWEQLYQDLGMSPLQAQPAQMDITVSPTQDSILFPYTDSLSNCKFLEDGFTVNSGDTKTEITVSMLITGITRFQ